MVLALACFAAFLVGGVPFGLILAKLLAGVDIRRIGSGNIGATNAARAFSGKGKRAAVFGLIYVLDFAKGFFPTWVLPSVLSGGDLGSPTNTAVAIGACAVLGHCFSPYLGFKGGKGVATGCGVFAAIEPWALLVALCAFALAYFMTRRVYIGSLTLGVALAVTVVLREPATALGVRASATVLAIVVAVFFFFTHRSNIRQARARESRA
jgi:glycerol-3-phosphate acyltransferase PlsY